jgi:ribosomal protein S18 acetylase RimI-like enzyme
MKIVECNEEHLKKDFLPLIIDLWYGDKFNQNNHQHVEWLHKKIHVNFANFSVAICVYSDEGEPVGYLWYQHDTGIEGVAFSGKAAHIIQMGLYEQYQRQGIGTMLLNNVSHRIKGNGGESLYTDTYANDNLQPMSFYIKNNFIPIAYHIGLNGTNDYGQVFMYKKL